MILQALNEYYKRKCDDPDPSKRLPAFGLEQKEIPFLLEITPEGALVQVRDTRELIGKKKVARAFRVPQGVKKTSGVTANLLWDTLEYVLGVDTKGKPERVAEQHAAFLARVNGLPLSVRSDVGVQAVARFLATIDWQRLEADPTWPEMLESNPVLTFRLHGDVDLVCQRPAIVATALNTTTTDDDAPKAMCLVSGEIATVERLHTAIKGVWGAQTSGANIVSFNARAFESYGKTERQGENAPVSKAVAFGYTTALNHLLGRASAQRVQLGDTSTVFWTDRDDEFEAAFADIFIDDPDRNADAVRAMYDSLQSGKLSGLRGDEKFHVLGLAPNAARASVRFYHCVPLRSLAARILAHFDDMKIARSDNDAEHSSLYRTLTAVATLGKADNIPPNLCGALVATVLGGERTLYPAMLLNAALNRCKADQAKKTETGRPVRHVSHLRAAIIKAYLVRYFRVHEPNRKEITVSQDNSNTDPPYLLGRLFAVYERMQEVAAGRDLNRTIRDSFFSAAMATPVTAFPRLVRLNQHHLRDIKRDRPASARFFDAILREINDKLNPPPFPSAFPLKEQGVFALGYYHQRHSLFQKSTEPPLTELPTLVEGNKS